MEVKPQRWGYLLPSQRFKQGEGGAGDEWRLFPLLPVTRGLPRVQFGSGTCSISIPAIIIITIIGIYRHQLGKTPSFDDYETETMSTENQFI